MAVERDYVLGTHEEELARLGLQHRVWRPVALDCWQRAGITVGKRVLDVGAGPGHAAIDLAEIVGPTGEVVALERSQNFIRALETTCRARSLANVKIHELDLMKGDLPKGDYDFAWCRWVVSFVNDQSLLIERLGGVMPKGSVAIFHEYGHYETWRFLPRLSMQERFREHVLATWHEAVREPDAALQLPALPVDNAIVIRPSSPHAFCVTFERGDDLRDDVVEWHSEFFRATHDVVAVYGAGECFIFHFLFHRAHIDVVNAFCRAHQRDRHDEATQLVHGVQSFFEGRFARNA